MYCVASCYPDEIQCWPGTCISASVACDGYGDCKDDFDESSEFCGKFRNKPVHSTAEQPCVGLYLLDFHVTAAVFDNVVSVADNAIMLQ